MSQQSNDRDRLVARAFVCVADSLVDDYDVADLLAGLIDHAIELLPIDAAGILLADTGGGLRIVASSSEEARLTELMQLQAHQGPWMDCYRTVAPVNVPNLAQAADRWPRFAAAAGTGELVFRAVHAVPLRLRGRAIGALNLFSRQPRAIPSGDLALAQALADVATIAILQERTIHRAEGLSERLQIALTSRVVIEQAKGVLAHYSGLSMDQVFDEMRCHARLHNRRLSDVAHAVAERTLHPGVVLSPNPAPTSGT